MMGKQYFSQLMSFWYLMHTCKVTHYICIHSYLVGLERWFLVFAFIKVSSLSMQAAKDLVRLHRCAGLSEPFLRKYSKTCVKWPLSKRPKNGFQDLSFSEVKSIAECSKGSILQYFQPTLSYHLSLRSLFCLFLNGRFTQVLLYVENSKISCVGIFLEGGRELFSRCYNK